MQLCSPSHRICPMIYFSTGGVQRKLIDHGENRLTKIVLPWYGGATAAGLPFGLINIRGYADNPSPHRRRQNWPYYRPIDASTTTTITITGTTKQQKITPLRVNYRSWIMHRCSAGGWNARLPPSFFVLWHPYQDNRRIDTSR